MSKSARRTALLLGMQIGRPPGNARGGDQHLPATGGMGEQIVIGPDASRSGLRSLGTISISQSMRSLRVGWVERAERERPTNSIDRGPLSPRSFDPPYRLSRTVFASTNNFRSDVSLVLDRMPVFRQSILQLTQRGQHRPTVLREMAAHRSGRRPQHGSCRGTQSPSANSTAAAAYWRRRRRPDGANDL